MPSQRSHNTQDETSASGSQIPNSQKQMDSEAAKAEQQAPKARGVDPAVAGLSNGRLAFFRQFIGRKLDNGPSPVGNWLAGILRSVEYGRFEMIYVVRPEMTNPFGTLHGGIISTMMDDTIGATIYAMDLGAVHGTVDLQVNFLRGAPDGSTVVAVSAVHRTGSRIVHASCDLLDTDGRLIARGSFNMLAIDSPIHDEMVREAKPDSE